MKIEILGTGCPKCRALADAVTKAVADLSLQAEVVKVTDIDEIVNRGVMLTPALVVDGEIVAVGKVPSTEELKKLLGGAR
ncbi:MAG: thioredoxin family protein [Thermotogota bacterium]